jgi:hypothetical protein
MENHYDSIKKDSFEVTFLLMLATTWFTIPNEKLNNLEKSGDHRNIKKFKKEVFDKLDNQKIIFAKVIKKDSYHQFEDYSDGSKKEEIKEMGEFLKIIRNALAHGNIFFVDDKKDNIQEVAFVSENRKQSNKCSECGNVQSILSEQYPYKYIHFKDIDEFKKFLELWFDFLKLT